MTLDRASPWLPPPAGWTKLNVDGGLTSPTSMRNGGILRDENGFWITGFSCREGHGDSFLVELSATFRGLNLAWSKGFRKVICELDYLDVVEALNNRHVVHLHQHASQIMDVWEILHQSWEVVISHVPRTQNQVADRLAILALDNKDMNPVMYYSPPLQILEIEIIE
ncbi:unnamed protein product [Lupinus luteus]|uniref:RNase H type-1 domain-containing protein n=1 Tax=Lupinus luteus TaxID=3873 RepID=A0AAV1XRX5_LUPLU